MHDDNNPDCPWNYPMPVVKGTVCDCDSPEYKIAQQQQQVSPKAGDVAKCQHGVIGLITKVRPNMLSGNRSLYRGVRLLPAEDAGKRWQSTRPEVLGDIDDFVTARYSGEI